MGFQDQVLRGASGTSGAGRFKLDARRMWKAFYDLLSPSALREAPATPRLLVSKPIHKQSELSMDCYLPTVPEEAETEAGTPGAAPSTGAATRTEDELSTAQAHAMCLIAFLSRLELRERRRQNLAMQQTADAKAALREEEILRRSITRHSPFATAGTVEEDTPRKPKGPLSSGRLLRIKWTGAARDRVQVAGTFSEPPWSCCIDLHFEPEAGAYVAELSPAVSACNSRELQFKFIVDGQWRLESTLPVCQDSTGNWNNMCRLQEDLSPAANDSALTSSLFAAASRAASDSAAAAAAHATTSADTAVSRGEEAADSQSQLKRADDRDNEVLWWPRYAEDDEDLEERRPPSRNFSSTEFTTGLRFQLEPPSPSTQAAVDNLRRGAGGAVTVGVADGVGEWDSFDLDPRLFAEELMKGCCDAAVAKDVEGETLDVRALDVLRRGYSNTRSFGSATALVVRHEGGDKIGIANLGDSAVIVLRRQLWYQMTCVFRSREQQHQFNCPFQLSRLPQPSEYDQLRENGKDALLHLLQNAAIIPQDTPETASLCCVTVMEGDLLILGTDGVFDNLFDYEICAITNLTLSPFEAHLLGNEALATSATAIATAIGEAAAHRRCDDCSRVPPCVILLLFFSL
ncbi:serine threonine specific protein phosphatase [Cyclospora cayetanensis]|uniref:Protein phosphatase n=1 Tax=Cyclospora cayetanensis TaxID=88456 RepID=A0A1D3CVM1_9EIME|nr:serine threonine specific protein phosphatase [Cyclospora cayetanensis]